MSNEIIDINEYKEIFSSIKNEILKSQYRAMQVVNVEMIYMYWNIGKIISNNIKCICLDSKISKASIPSEA